MQFHAYNSIIFIGLIYFLFQISFKLVMKLLETIKSVLSINFHSSGETYGSRNNKTLQECREINKCVISLAITPH